MLLGAFGSGCKEILARTPARDSLPTVPTDGGPRHERCRRGRGALDRHAAVGPRVGGRGSRSRIRPVVDREAKDPSPGNRPRGPSPTGTTRAASALGLGGRPRPAGESRRGRGGDPPVSRCRGRRAVERSADRRPARALQARGFRGGAEPHGRAEGADRAVPPRPRGSGRVLDVANGRASDVADTSLGRGAARAGARWPTGRRRPPPRARRRPPPARSGLCPGSCRCRPAAPRGCRTSAASGPRQRRTP